MNFTEAYTDECVLVAVLLRRLGHSSWKWLSQVLNAVHKIVRETILSPGWAWLQGPTTATTPSQLGSRIRF